MAAQSQVFVDGGTKSELVQVVRKGRFSDYSGFARAQAGELGRVFINELPADRFFQSGLLWFSLSKELGVTLHKALLIFFPGTQSVDLVVNSPN